MSRKNGRENEPAWITVTIDRRKGKEDIKISLFGILDWSLDRFLANITDAAKWTGTVYRTGEGRTVQASLQQEKQRLLGKTIRPERENNPQNIRPLQEGNQQGPDRGEAVSETGETYDIEREAEEERKRHLALGMVGRTFERDSGYYVKKEAES